MISLIPGIIVLTSFCHVLYECVKEEGGGGKKIWVVNTFNLVLGILLILN